MRRFRQKQVALLSEAERAGLANALAEETADPLRHLKRLLDFLGLRPEGDDDEEDV